MKPTSISTLFLKRTVTLAVVAALTGCADLSVLQPKPDLSQFYYLEQEPQAFSGSKSLTIEVGRGRIPKYLDNPSIVTFTAKNVIQYSDSARWAEPLQESINRYLCSVLSVELETSNVIPSHEVNNLTWDYRVGYDIHKLGGQPGERVEIIVTWWVQDGRGTAKRFESSRIAMGTSGRDDYAGYVSLIRQAVRGWGLEVARTIHEMEASENLPSE